MYKLFEVYYLSENEQAPLKKLNGTGQHKLLTTGIHTHTKVDHIKQFISFAYKGSTKPWKNTKFSERGKAFS